VATATAVAGGDPRATSLLGGPGRCALLDPPGRRGKAIPPPSPRAPAARSGGGAAERSEREGRRWLTLAARDAPRERVAGVFFFFFCPACMRVLN
jgi:hypothetical protein